MSIPQPVADQLLAECGRHCCLCRRFQPLCLQVHHIRPQAEGGTNDPDNLIALCLNCHSSVHTKAGMARNFTFDELKLHKHNTITAVREGRLVGDSDTPSAFDEMLKGLLAAILPALAPATPSKVRLLPEAVEVLVAAAKHGGVFYPVPFDGGWVLQCGPIQFGGDFNDHRRLVKYQKAFNQLAQTAFLEQVRDALWQVTDDGYRVADQLIAAATVRSNG